MSKAVNVAIVGSGVVGGAFVDQLLSVKSNITYNVVAILNYQASLVSESLKPLPITTANWREYFAQHTEEKTVAPAELLALLQKSTLPVIVVDNTSNEGWANSYPDFVANGISIATPNKKAFSSGLALWEKLFPNDPKAGLVYHEATVGAGLPIVNFLKEIIETGDEVEKIEGIFSGTLSYIFNEYSTIEKKDVKFSDIVKVAKQLGYTEPDPRDDLNGLDVARKVTILARISGLKVESPSSFPVQSLIPAPLESVSTSQEFLDKLPQYDDEIQKLKDEAAAENKVLRFIGQFDVQSQKASVGIAKYDYSHPFAGLKGSDNVISIKTKRYTNPVVVQGAGAGAAVTAAGVLSDVIKIAQRL
ncbi:Homoserine dehydrogenase [Hanseniaspora vineae]